MLLGDLAHDRQPEPAALATAGVGAAEETIEHVGEIIGNDPDKLRSYYGELFGWEFDTPSPVAPEVSEPESYGFLDLITSEDGTGIRGGVGGGPSYKSHAVFYVVKNLFEAQGSHPAQSDCIGSFSRAGLPEA